MKTASNQKKQYISQTLKKQYKVKLQSLRAWPLNPCSMEATVPVQCTYCTVYSKAHFGQVNSISLHAILEISFTADTDMVCGSAHFSLTDHISSLVAKVILCF